MSAASASPDLLAMVAAMTPEEQRVATRVLDAISRPLRPREIEGLLRAKGIQRARAVILAGTLKHFHILAMIGPEDAPAEPAGHLPLPPPTTRQPMTVIRRVERVAAKENTK